MRRRRRRRRHHSCSLLLLSRRKSAHEEVERLAAAFDELEMQAYLGEEEETEVEERPVIAK